MKLTIRLFITVFTSLLLNSNSYLLSQTSCFKRTLKEVGKNLFFCTDEIDSICNGLIVWSEKHGYFGYEIHHNQYDANGRIRQKVMWNYIRVELSFRPPEDFPQYKSYHTDQHTLTRIDTVKYNYILKNSSTKTPRFLDNKKERIVFELLTNRIHPFESTQVNFYYEYKEDTLLIRKEEFDWKGELKTDAILIDTTWRSSLVNKRKRIKIINQENSYSVRLIDDKTLDIRSEKIPLKPSPHAGAYFCEGINCKVLLDKKYRVKKIDHHWMGKTIFDYDKDKLSSLTKYNRDKIYKQQTVQ